MQVHFVQPKQLRPVKAWSWDLWGYPEVSGMGTFVVDHLGPVCWSIGPPWISTSHRCLIGLGSGKFGGQVITLHSVFCSSSCSWAVFECIRSHGPARWATAIRECCGHEGVHLVHNCVWIGRSSGIYMNAKTHGCSAEHCIVTRWSMLFTSPVSGFNV